MYIIPINNQYDNLINNGVKSVLKDIDDKHDELLFHFGAIDVVNMEELEDNHPLNNTDDNEAYRKYFEDEGLIKKAKLVKIR